MMQRSSTEENTSSDRTSGEENTNQNTLPERLSIACDSILIGEYGEALATITEARSLHPGNIFLETMVKQVELLLSLTNDDALTEEQRTEILDTLPSLVECATVEAEDVVPAAIQAPSPVQAPPTEPERKVVVAGLINEFLKNIDVHINQGEYQNALTEIQRIYRIDPHNSTAKALEQSIARKVTATTTPFVRSVASTPPMEVEQKTDPGFKPSALDPAPTVAPQPVVRPVLRVERPAPPEPAKRRPTVLIITLVVAALGLGALIYLQSTETNEIAQAPLAQPEAKDETGLDLQTQPVASPSPEPMSETPPLVNDSASSAKPAHVDIVENKPEEKKDVSTPEPQTQQPIKMEQTPAQSALKEKTTISEKRNVGTSRVQTTLTSDRPAEKSLAVNERPVIKEPAPPPTGIEPLPEVTAPLPAFVAVQKDPQIIRLEKPKIPDRAFINGKSGQVVVRVQIGPDGKPLQAKIAKSSNPLLNDAVIEAVMKSQYSPGMMSSGPVTTWVSIPFNIKK